ncbi:MAG: 50S ribosomal protein L35 [Oscillospiraceae bacterium]|nr:50S ribosomal protein L35 [Oscillospiraceae bacterium]
MPKMKTHSGAKKRFNLTKTGKVKKAKAYKSHILTKKTTKRTRHLRAGGYADVTTEATIRKMIPYK